jgi:hypothetical protein
MIEMSEDEWRRAFPIWLRTGRLPASTKNDAIERKFNPWHDPSDGRFTFAGTGHYYGAGKAKPTSRAPNILGRDNPQKPRIAAGPKPEARRAEQPARLSGRPEERGATGGQPKPIASRLGDQPNPAAEFVGGVGEGVYGVAEGAVSAAHSVLTTNPATTIRNAGVGIASMIDTAIAAEDTPARIQVSRAVDAVANASPREIGRATGSVAGNVALAVVPGAALGKISALRRLRGAPPRTSYDPPQIGWVKENLGRDTPAKLYNDSATGAQPGQAPTLMRTMPDGSKRPVKFDGIQGEYVIDRKWRVVNRPRARAQLLRQSEVLAQHRLIGTWEVPNEAERIAALKLLRKMNVTNIKVRVVKP